MKLEELAGPVETSKNNTGRQKKKEMTTVMMTTATTTTTTTMMMMMMLTMMIHSRFGPSKVVVGAFTPRLPSSRVEEKARAPSARGRPVSVPRLQHSPRVRAVGESRGGRPRARGTAPIRQ